MDPRFNDETKAYIKFMRHDFPPPTDFTIDIIRKRSEYLHGKINEKLIGTFRGIEEEKRVRINETTEIPITIYTPVEVNQDKIVVFFHGGGWTLNSRKTHQTIVNMLADATKSVWISVEYRLAPEHKFPIWLDDACEVTREIIANKAAYGGNNNTKVGVAGDSAGGLIAASVCHTIENIDFQILINGQFEFANRIPSRNKFDHPDFFITTQVLDWFASNALRDEDDKRNPRIALLHNKLLKMLPTCLLITAELDPLRDDSYDYQELLEKCGVKTKLIVIKGVVHPFFSLPGIFGKASQEVLCVIEEFMKNL